MKYNLHNIDKEIFGKTYLQDIELEDFIFREMRIDDHFEEQFKEEFLKLKPTEVFTKRSLNAFLHQLGREDFEEAWFDGAVVEKYKVSHEHGETIVLDGKYHKGSLYEPPSYDEVEFHLPLIDIVFHVDKNLLSV